MPQRRNEPRRPCKWWKWDVDHGGKDAEWHSNKAWLWQILTMFIPTMSAMTVPRGDTDGDGKLRLAEYQALNRTRLMRADSDGNGKISLEEWTARRAATKAKGDRKSVV